jgi:hypothetical protein
MLRVVEQPLRDTDREGAELLVAVGAQQRQRERMEPRANFDVRVAKAVRETEGVRIVAPAASRARFPNTTSR